LIIKVGLSPRHMIDTSNLKPLDQIVQVLLSRYGCQNEMGMLIYLWIVEEL
jgi:hypothetical protein